MNHKQPKVITFILWLTGLLLYQQSMAQNTSPNINKFSVEQCAAYAAKNNVQVKNALLAIQVQKETNRGITAAALPSITGSAGLTDYINIPVSLVPGEFFGQPAGTFIPVRFGTKYNANAGIQLQQLLFDGQVFVGLQARAASIEYQNKNAQVTEEAIRTNIYKIYYQLVVAKSQVALLDANIALLEKLQNDVGEMFKNGFAERLDVDKLNVQFSNLQTEKTKVLNNIEMGYLGLKTLMGMPVKDSLVLTDTITDDNIKEQSLSDAAFQYTDRKDYQLMQTVKKLNEYNIKRYRLSYIPTVSLSGAFTKQAQRTKFTIFEKGDWFTTSFIGLNINIPIFDGFYKDAKIKQSRIELKQVENTIDNLKISADAEVQQAIIKFRSAILTMDAQKKNMILAEKVYNQTKKKFEAGTGSNTEINTAQTDLKAAQTNYISALYDAVIAKVDYLKATGKL
jgi:outer membrane protein TolC